MLTSLQERVATILASLAEAEDFALAGAGALILRGDVQRETFDLDFFATSPAEVGRLLPALEEALKAAGLRTARVRVSDGFARLDVADRHRSTTVDLCWDSRLWPTEPTSLGPTLAAEELAASKMLALFTRAEARDFVDVYALVQRHGLDHICRLASEKDHGFHTAALVDALGAIARLPRSAFNMTDDALDELYEAVAEWRATLQT